MLEHWQARLLLDLSSSLGHSHSAELEVEALSEELSPECLSIG